jgi:glycosyltransferase involved in cell wall biosynthesis
MFPSDSSGKLHGLRIGFFTSVIPMGGSEVVVADAMEAAHRHGARLVCWCHPEAALRKLLAEKGLTPGVELIDWPPTGRAAGASGNGSPGKARSHCSLWRGWAPGWLKRLVGFFRDAQPFEAELGRVPVDLLLVNVNGFEPVALAARRMVGKRLVSCYHLSLSRSEKNAPNRFVEWVMKTLCMWSSGRVVHVSRRVRDQWCRFCTFPRRRTRIIYNGVDDVPLPRAGSKRAELGLGPEEFVFCVPGRCHPMKGHPYLIEALAADPVPFRSARVLVCGDGEHRAGLEKRCEAAGLKGIVRFLGWRSDLKEILRDSDVAVLPSVASENLSLAVLESLIVGTPAIVTDVGGMAEAVRHGETGLVVPPASPRHLREAMLRFLADPEDARRMGQRARQDALERFTRRRMMDEYVRLFAELSVA